MQPRITLYVDQGTTAVFTASLYLRGLPLVPDDLNWSLTDSLGVTINSRKSVLIAPAADVNIVLSGNDLAALEPFDDLVRVLTLEGHYTSIDGAGLAVVGEYRFGLNELVGL